MSFNAGTIMGYLHLDRSGFTSGMLEAQGLTGLLGRNISTFLANPLLGVAGMAKEAVGGIMELTNRTAETAAHFEHLGKTVGASTEFISSLAYAGKMTGTGMEELTMGLEFLTRNAGDAARGTGQAGAAFQQLGVSLRDSSGHVRSTQDLFMDTAQALSGIHDASLRASVAQDIFGRGAATLMPLLAKGKGGINELMAEAQRLGVTFDENSAGASHRFELAMTRLKSSFTGLAQQVAIPVFTALAPVIENIAGSMGSNLAPILSSIGGLFGQMMPIITSLVQNIGGLLGPALGMIGGLMAQLAPTITKLVSTLASALMPVISAVFDIFKALSPVLIPVLDLVGSLAQLASAILVPALKLLTPVLQVIASILGGIVEMISKIVGFTTGVFSGIGRALGLGGNAQPVPTPAPTPVNANVTVQVAPGESARRVADAIAPAVARSISGVQYRIEDASRRRMDVHNFEAGLALR